MHAMLNPIAGSDLVTTNHIEAKTAAEFLAVLLEAGVDVLEFRGHFLRLDVAMDNSVLGLDVTVDEVPAGPQLSTFRCQYVVDDRTMVEDVQAASVADAVARVTHDAICEGANVDLVTIDGQSYGAVPVKSLYSVDCDAEDINEMLVWVETPDYSNEAGGVVVQTLRERHEELESERDELRKQLEAHRGAAENLQMPISTDYGATPCWSDGETGDEPPRGWHYLLGGPYTSYTIPTPDTDGVLGWWKHDDDEGCWAEYETLGARVVDDQVHTHESCEEAEAALEAALAEIKRLRTPVVVQSRPDEPASVTVIHRDEIP